MPGERPSPREFLRQDEEDIARRNAQTPDASLRDLAEHGSNLNQRFAALQEQQVSGKLTAREEAELNSLQQQLDEVNDRIGGKTPAETEQTRNNVGRASENKY